MALAYTKLSFLPDFVIGRDEVFIEMLKTYLNYR